MTQRPATRPAPTARICIAVALGVLIDTFLVRTVLVPAAFLGK